MTDISSSVPEEELEDDIEDLEPETPSPEDAALEQRARGLGWHPFAEYRGSPGRWVDAKTFIERGEQILPIVRAQNHRLEDQVKKQGDIIVDLTKTVQEQKEVLQEMRTFARNADERGYQRAMQELEAKRDAAIDAQDKDTVRQVDKEIRALEAGHAEKPNLDPPPVPRAAQQQPAVDPTVLAFVEANPWFNTSPRLNAKMVAEHLDVMADYPEMALADQLDLAASNLKARHPEMFGDPPAAAPRARPRAASVAQPSAPAAPRRQPATGIDSIADPEERKQARDAFSRMKRQIPDYTEAEYMMVYDNPKADVIAARQAKKGNRDVRA